MLSQSSKLLVRQWDVVQEIFQAEKQLRREMTALLTGLKADLLTMPWWREGWVFVTEEDKQVYISRKSWHSSNAYVLWIGIEEFTPESLFGSDSSAYLYVWANGKRQALADDLTGRLRSDGTPILGDIGDDDFYIISQPLPKCLPDEVDTFETMVRERILDFFNHYAPILSRLDDVIVCYV